MGVVKKVQKISDSEIYAVKIVKIKDEESIYAVCFFPIFRILKLLNFFTPKDKKGIFKLETLGPCKHCKGL